MPPVLHWLTGRCWWHGSRSWTFLPIVHYILLPCDRWQQRGTLTEGHLTWTCIWSKDVELNSSMWKKKMAWHSLTFVEHLLRSSCRCEQWDSVCCVSAVVAANHLHQHRFWWVWHAGSCSLWKCTANSGDYVEKSVLQLRSCSIK